MRLFLLTPSYPPMIGGGEGYVRALALELTQRGHDVTVVTSAISQPDEFWAGASCAREAQRTAADGVTVLRLPVRPVALGRFGQLLLRKSMVVASLLGPVVEPLLARCSRAYPHIVGLETALQRLPRPDLVHSFNISWERCLLAGRALAQAAAIPHVVTPFVHVGAPGDRRVWRNSAMPQQRRVLAEANAVLAMTETERAGIIALGARADRVRVVGAAVSPLSEDAARPEPAVVARLTATDAPLFLALGRADRDKGALVALCAVVELQQRGVACQLALAGHPSSEAVRLAERLSAAGAPVHLLGPVNDATKAWLLQRCYALVLPSRVESFGLVLLEAWQRGKPVVAAAVGGPQDLIQPGCNGLLTPWGDPSALADALRALLADAVLARRLGETGRAQVAETYTWPSVASRVEAVYRDVLGSAVGGEEHS